MSLYLCECGTVTVQTEMRVHGVRCNNCPAPVTERWWFRLDEWCHRHLPRWVHRPLCAYVEWRLWGPATSQGDSA